MSRPDPTPSPAILEDALLVTTPAVKELLEDHPVDMLTAVWSTLNVLADALFGMADKDHEALASYAGVAEKCSKEVRAIQSMMMSLSMPGKFKKLIAPGRVHGEIQLFTIPDNSLSPTFAKGETIFYRRGWAALPGELAVIQMRNGERMVRKVRYRNEQLEVSIPGKGRKSIWQKVEGHSFNAKVLGKLA